MHTLWGETHHDLADINLADAPLGSTAEIALPCASLKRTNMQRFIRCNGLFVGMFVILAGLLFDFVSRKDIEKVAVSCIDVTVISFVGFVVKLYNFAE